MTVEASWILEGASSEGPVESVDADATSKTVSLFARGLLTPFQRDQKNDFANGTGGALMKSQVEQIVGMASAAPDGSSYGEIEWDQSFGTQLHRVRHRRLNGALAGLLRYFVAEAVPRLAPDVRLASLRIVLDKNQRASRLIGKVQPVDGRGAAVGPDIPIDVPLSGEEDPS